MKLSVRALNALWWGGVSNSLWGPPSDAEYLSGPPKELVAEIPHAELIGMPNLGKVSLAEIAGWLAEDGLSIKAVPDGLKVTKAGTVTQKRLDAAVDLLRRHGYKVRAP